MVLTPEMVDCSGILLIQGESGVGKTTIIEMISPVFGAIHYDTSKVWRAIAAWGKHCKINFDDAEGVAQMAKHFQYEEIGGRSFIAGLDLTDQLRTQETTSVVSLYGGVKCLRAAYTKMTIEWVTARPAIVSGRMMHEVFPGAPLIHITRDPVEAKRFRELQEGEGSAASLKQRNLLDAQNAIAAGTNTANATIVDVTGMGELEQATAVAKVAMSHGFKRVPINIEWKQKVSV